MSYAPEIDKALLKRMLLKLKALPEDQRIKGLDFIFKNMLLWMISLNRPMLKLS